MSQINHDDCWIPVSDPPSNQRRVIIWTKKPWLPKTDRAAPLSRHLDMHGAWYHKKEDMWYHSDGSIAYDVTHWMEMLKRPARGA